MSTFGTPLWGIPGSSGGIGGSTPPPPAATLPTINSFSALGSAAPIMLSWDVTGATSLSINPGVGAVTGSSVSVSPTTTTTYILTASNAAGSVSASVTVVIHGPSAENVRYHQIRRNDRQGDGLDFQMSGPGNLGTVNYPALYDSTGNVMARQPRGNTTQTQMAGGSSFTPGNLPIYDTFGNLIDSGAQPSGSGGSGGTTQGQWFQEVPRGNVDGANRAFTTTYVPTPNYIILVLNGYTQSPYFDFTIPSGTNVITYTIAPRPGDQMTVWYFAGSQAPSGGSTGGPGTGPGTEPGGTGGGTTPATPSAVHGLHITTSQSNSGVTEGGGEIALVSANGQASFTFLMDLNADNGGDAWPETTNTIDISNVDPSLQFGPGWTLTIYIVDSFPPHLGTYDLDVYGASLDVTYPDGSTGTLTPTTASILYGGNVPGPSGSDYIVNVNNAIDGDPTTAATIHRTTSNGSYPVLILGGWADAALSAPATTNLAIPATAMPWIVTGSLNTGYPYGQQDGTAPVILTGISTGTIITVQYQSGLITNGHGIETPFFDANGNPGQPPTLGTLDPLYGLYPTVYMSNPPAAQSRVGALVGVFTDSSGNVIEAVAFNDGPTTVTAPPDASQLQIGINDNTYADNAGSFNILVTTRAGSGGGTGSGGTGGASGGDVAAQIYGDMTGVNEGHPHGVPSSYDFYTGPSISEGNNPQGQSALEWWSGLYVGPNGNPATNTLVNVRNCAIYWLQASTGTWHTTTFTAADISSDQFSEDWTVDYNTPVSLRTETDGSFSYETVSGRVAHLYAPYPRVPILPNDIAGVVAVCEARLILNNPSGTDDRSTASFLLDCGADYYPTTTSAGIENNPGVGLGKFKYVETGWRSFCMTSMTLAALEANPPPVDFTGASS